MSDINDNLLNMFSDLLEDEGKTEETQDNVEIDPSIPLEIEETVDIKSSKPKKKKTGETKKAELREFIDEAEGVYRLNSFNYHILETTSLTSVGICDVSVETPNSWIELLIILLGSVYTYYKDLAKNEAETVRAGKSDKSNKEDEADRLESFEISLATKGVLNKDVKLIREQPLHLDSEINEGLEIYRIPETEYMVEIYYDAESLFSSIRNCLLLLGLHPMIVDVALVNKNITVEKPEPITISETYTLEELAETDISDFIQIESVGIDGDESEVCSLVDGVLLILTFLIITHTEIKSEPSTEETEDYIETKKTKKKAKNNQKENNIQKILKKSSLRDSVGVTDDPSDYLGIMRTVLLPSTNLYFYSNGSSRLLLDYLSNICINLGVDKNSITFKYRIQIDPEDKEIESEDKGIGNRGQRNRK